MAAGLRIIWQQRMTNNKVVEMTEIKDIGCEVRRSDGTVRTQTHEKGLERLSYSNGEETRKAKGETEIKRPLEEGLLRKRETKQNGSAAWNVAKAVAGNREYWSEILTALCAFWRAENG